MHYHLEIVMPPVPDVDKAVEQIMGPFDESPEDENGEDANSHAFWDWYVIGGRWSGAKVECGLDEAQKNKFYAALKEKKVTVSGLQAGKQRLEPAAQIPMVDALFKKFFPDSPLRACPFFDHFNDQYKNSEGFPDIMRLGDTPKALESSRLIIAKPHWEDESLLEAAYMLEDETWNGINHQSTMWDSTVASALASYAGKISRYKPEYAEKVTPTDDWLCVTVDYHS
jgi:hypothetical protein